MTQLIRTHTAISLHHLSDEYTLVRPHGLPLHLYGSRQAGRIYDHTGLRLPWATMATYAYYADPCPDPDHPGPGYIPDADH